MESNGEVYRHRLESSDIVAGEELSILWLQLQDRTGAVTRDGKLIRWSVCWRKVSGPLSLGGPLRGKAIRLQWYCHLDIGTFGSPGGIVVSILYTTNKGCLYNRCLWGGHKMRLPGTTGRPSYVYSKDGRHLFSRSGEKGWGMLNVHVFPFVIVSGSGLFPSPYWEHLYIRLERASKAYGHH